MNCPRLRLSDFRFAVTEDKRSAKEHILKIITEIKHGFNCNLLYPALHSLEKLDPVLRSEVGASISAKKDISDAEKKRLREWKKASSQAELFRIHETMREVLPTFRDVLSEGRLIREFITESISFDPIDHRGHTSANGFLFVAIPQGYNSTAEEKRSLQILQYEIAKPQHDQNPFFVSQQSVASVSPTETVSLQKKLNQLRNRQDKRISGYLVEVSGLKFPVKTLRPIIKREMKARLFDSGLGRLDL